MIVYIEYMEDDGFYLVNELGDIVCARIFADEDEAATYCDKMGYNLAEPA